MANDPKDLVRCPLCKGPGQLSRREAVERLESRDFKEKITGYVTAMREEQEEAKQPPTQPVSREEDEDSLEFEHKVLSGAVHQPLWRRSPKE